MTNEIICEVYDKVEQAIEHFEDALVAPGYAVELAIRFIIIT